MPLIIDDADADANSRLVSIRLAMLTLRCMENWRRDVGDCEKALVLVAVLAISGERFTRGGKLGTEFKTLRKPLPRDLSPRCNVSSIAAATGLNRETARRKVIELADAGILCRPSSGMVSFQPGILEQESTLEVMREQLKAVIRVVNDMLRDGPVKIC